MTTILVTGGAGFIGSNFVLEVLKNHPQYKIINLDLLTYAGNLHNLSSIEGHPQHIFVKGDIIDQKLVGQLFREHQINGVVHFAAESHVDRSIKDPAAFLRTNVMGTFSLLQEALLYWKETNQLDKNRFLHVSTDEVYGSLGPTGYFTESTAYAPNSPYSASKASSDHMVRSYHHTFGMQTLITNCSNNYGPFQFPEKLIPLILNNILHKKPLPVYGDGKNIRDWLYVVDHCQAILEVFQKGEPGGHYNIGGHNEWANIDIVHLLCDQMDSKLGRPLGSSRNLITYVKDRPGHDRRYAIDASYIKQELNWTPKESFETGISKTIDWYLENQKWLEQVTSGAYQDYYTALYQNR